MFKTIQECRVELVSHSVSIKETEVDDEYGFGIVRVQTTDDFMPCSAARASFGNEDKTGEDVAKDVKLMKYLSDHKHMTPFEYQHATMLVEVPLFIRSQIHRHRTFSFNEISRRYTSDDIEFFIPDAFRGQAKNNKQASEGVLGNYEERLAKWKVRCEKSLENYYEQIADGVAREIARAELPQSLITRFYMGGKCCPVSW